AETVSCAARCVLLQLDAAREAAGRFTHPLQVMIATLFDSRSATRKPASRGLLAMSLADEIRIGIATRLQAPGLLVVGRPVELPERVGTPLEKHDLLLLAELHHLFGPQQRASGLGDADLAVGADRLRVGRELAQHLRDILRRRVVAGCEPLLQGRIGDESLPIAAVELLELAEV